MNCLIASATAREITPFLNHYRITSGQWENNINIDVMITGIGLTTATYHLTKYFAIKRPDLVIQAGIAGCFNKEIPLGSVVAIKQDTIADESVIELKKLHTLFDLQLIPQNHFPYKKGWLTNPTNEAIKKTKLTAVKGISVNQISTSKKMIQLYKDKFNPVAESMEGAALHYVCLMEKITFLQIRSLSNYVGERNKKKWKMNESIINLNNELISLLHKL